MLKFVSRRTNVEPILEIMLAAWMYIAIDQVTACIVTGSPDRSKEKFIVKEFSIMTYSLR